MNMDWLSRKLRFGRAALRFCVILWVIAGCLTEYAVTKLRGRLSGSKKAEILHRWCAWLLPRLGVRLKVIGAAPAAGLIVSNHLSYVDILIFSATAPCVFV